MFLRKITVILVPLILLAAVCLLLPLVTGLGFWDNVIKGVLLGAVLALLLPLSGASRRREPFGGLLWVPTALTAAAVACQYLDATGTKIPVLSALATLDGQVVLFECIFFGFMLVTCIRTAR